MNPSKPALAALLALCVAAPAAATPAGEALSRLEQANRLRDRNREEQAAFEARQRSAKAAQRLLAARLVALRAERDLLTEQVRKMRAEAEQGPLEAERARLYAELERRAKALHEGLDKLQIRAFPGVVPPRPAPAETAPDALRGALDRLDRAETATERVQVTVVEGRLGDTPLTVQLLRVGAAAWWRSLDGGQAGIARMDGGVLRLEPASPEDLSALLTAFDVAKGRRSPEPIHLPWRR